MAHRGWFLLGAPWDCSGTGRGEALGPEALRAAGLSQLVDLDVGDVATVISSTVRDPLTGVVALPETVAAARALAGTLATALAAADGRRPLVIGGDCSILLGILPALRAHVGEVGLWFLDGHPDYLDGASSDTGETADMDLAILTGRGADALISLAGVSPMVPTNQAVLLGHRTTGLDAGSGAEVARLPVGLRTIDAGTVVRDPRAAGVRALEYLAEGNDGVWLHIDLDVLDARAMPAVTYPQPDGLDWHHLDALLAPLATSPALLGISIADLRPDLDPTGDIARRLIDLVSRALT